ncbi:MAG: hypothetical protein CR966_00345 [Pseudomonadales bacterium]|nr:MAG: hypothetical protein CR966_00345 [Pseudomonadales bacterium]
MKKLLLPIIIGSALSVTACCDCQPTQGRIAELNKERTNKHNDNHDKDGKKQAQEQANKNDKQPAKTPDTVASDTVANVGTATAVAVGAFNWDKVQASNSDIANLGTFPYFKTAKDMKLVIASDKTSADQPTSKALDNTTLNLFDGEQIVSETGKLSYLNFVMAEDGKDFDKASFDTTVTDFMKSIGAVEFYNGEVPTEITETIIKMDDDKTTHNQEYMDGEPADFKGRSVRQFAVKNANGKLIYQVMSNDTHGEVGVMEVAGFISPLSQQGTAQATDNTPAKEDVANDTDADNAKKQVAEEAKLKAEEEAKKKAEEEGKKQAELKAQAKKKAEERKKPTASEMTEQIDKSGKMVLNINFDSAKATIKKSDVSLIDEIYKMMRKDPTLKLSIEGYTDSSGAKAMNQKLSTARAREVKAELEKKGIEANRLKASGYGESKPIASNDSAEGRAKNRRVELVKFD